MCPGLGLQVIETAATTWLGMNDGNWTSRAAAATSDQSSSGVFITDAECLTLLDPLPRIHDGKVQCKWDRVLFAVCSPDDRPTIDTVTLSHARVRFN